MSNLSKSFFTILFVFFLIFSSASAASISFGRTYNPSLSPVDSLSFKIYCSLSTFPLFWMDNDKCYTVEGVDSNKTVYIKAKDNTIQKTSQVLLLPVPTLPQLSQ